MGRDPRSRGRGWRAAGGRPARTGSHWAGLWEARRAVLEVVSAPAARVGGASAYTDGSMVDGRDALLARAACGCPGG